MHARVASTRDKQSEYILVDNGHNREERLFRGLLAALWHLSGEKEPYIKQPRSDVNYEQ